MSIIDSLNKSFGPPDAASRAVPATPLEYREMVAAAQIRREAEQRRMELAAKAMQGQQFEQLIRSMDELSGNIAHMCRMMQTLQISVVKKDDTTA